MQSSFRIDKTSESPSQATLFQRISDICNSVNTVIGESELLEISLTKMMELFGAVRGSIFTLNKNGKDLTLKTSQGMKFDERQTLVRQMGEGIVGRVAELKEPIFVEDITKDGRFSDFKARGSYQTHSFICSPLIVKDKLIGVINISDKESKDDFNEDDMLLLDFLSSQIALNYRRVQLYNKFKKVVKKTHSLKDKLGQTGEETRQLKEQIIIQERLATIGKLAGGIAHEFNNPLDGVMRYTNLCLSQVKEDEVLRGYLLEVKHGLKRMANIVKSLLACSRNEFPQNGVLNIIETLDHALKVEISGFAHKNITIQKDIQDNIPDIRDLGFERILTNLFRNAIDAMKDGGTLSIKGECASGVVTLRITDTGTGIEPQNIGKILDPFFTTKDIDKGCGLGLTIVGEIVKSYNGQIDIESEIGKGTTFIIKLPLL